MGVQEASVQEVGGCARVGCTKGRAGEQVPVVRGVASW